ncbi:hypothetical protein BGX26_010037 [Mortierella sp. AD094]|nr:hypothetical protein BGX26_010037 [Mortierella sp. AD094]
MHVVHMNICSVSFYLEGVPGKDETCADGDVILKLWNFDQARFVGKNVDTTTATAGHTAPEIMSGDILAAEIPMNQWSLGLIIYELRTYKPYITNPAKKVYTRTVIKGLLETEAEKRFTHKTLLEVYFGNS